jgi:hypothetical protein
MIFQIPKMAKAANPGEGAAFNSTSARQDYSCDSSSVSSVA